MIRMNGSVARMVATSVLAAGMVGLAACTSQTRDEAGEAADEVGDVVESAGEDIATAVDVAADEAELALQRAEVQLDWMGERMEAGAEYAADEAADDVANLRSDLAMAYENAEGEAAEAWDQADRELDEAEVALRAGSAEALGNLAALLERIRADLLSDDENPG